MGKLKKEDIYINLQGKSKEELTELQDILITFNEPTYRKDFKTFYKEKHDVYLGLDEGEWITNVDITNKQEVTIQQLKEILQPMETYNIREYSTGDFMDLGKEVGIIKAKNEKNAWGLYKETHRLQDSERGFFSFIK